MIEQRSTFTARQKVGRGIRLCVNQNGDRIDDRNINILHVMANESFTEFAENLQKEIEAETGIKFGILDFALFSGLTYTTPVIEEKKPTIEQSQAIFEYVKALIATTQKSEISDNTVANEQEELPTITPPPIIASLAPVIKEAITAVKMGAEITPEKVAEISYTQTVEVEKSVSDGNALIASYVYDEAGQLTRINDAVQNKTFVYQYDASGNIRNRKEYVFTTGNLGTVVETVSYTYGNANWKDQLTGFNGKAITYDASGNPLTFGNRSFE